MVVNEDLYNPVVDRQTWLRIILAIAAYAYEFEDHSIMDDSEFDKLSREVDLTVNTRRPDLDEFFRKEFSYSTGMWIHEHPELNAIKILYERTYKNLPR